MNHVLKRPKKTLGSFDSGRLLAVTEDAELHEDGGVFDHGAKRSDEPGEVDEKVFFLDGVEENL